MADSKRKKTSGYFVTVGTGEKIQYNSNPTRSKPKVTETQKQAAEARVQQYRSAAKENASTQSGLSKPAKITSDVSGEAWTRATPSQTKLPSGYTSSQERELSQLAELRRQAQVDLDTDTLNSVDKRMKEIRAQAGKQTGFERVGSVLSGSGKLYGGQLAGTAGTLVEGAGKLNTRIENYTNQEKLQTAEDNINRYQQMLSSGKDLAGKALTAEDRKRIQSYIKQNQAVLDAHKNYTAAVENADKETADTLYGKSLDLIESGSKDVEKAKEDLGFVGRAAVDLGVAGTQMAADAALGTVTGTALIPMFIRSFGGGAIEAKQNGATYGQQLAYGALSAGTEVATEKISNVSGVFKKVYGGGVVDEAVKKAVKKLSSNAVGQALLTAGASAGGEGFEEFVSDVFAPIWQRATYAKDPYVSDKYGAGNIDLKNRPQYQNADGTISTVDSWSFNIDGKEVLLPSVWMKDGKPYHSSNADEILRHYKETGEYLGKFDTVEQANAYAKKLHQEQNQYYNVYQNAKFDLGEAMYDAMIGAAMGLIGDAGNIVNTTRSASVDNRGVKNAGNAVDVSPMNSGNAVPPVDAQTAAQYNNTTVSPAASEEVQQTEAQAQVTQAENPGFTVLDAATTLFTQQGMKLKTAQEKAGIVQKLIAGEEVSVRDINKLNPTSKESQAIFTQLTGVQFPDGKVTQEQLYNLYRSANTAAVQAREQQRAQQVAQEAAFRQAAMEQVQAVQERQETPAAQEQQTTDTLTKQMADAGFQANPETQARIVQAQAELNDAVNGTATADSLKTGNARDSITLKTGDTLTRDQFKQVMQELYAEKGVNLTGNQLDAAFNNFLSTADRGGDISGLEAMAEYLKNKEEGNNGGETAETERTGGLRPVRGSAQRENTQNDAGAEGGERQTVGGTHGVLQTEGSETAEAERGSPEGGEENWNEGSVRAVAEIRDRQRDARGGRGDAGYVGAAERAAGDDVLSEVRGELHAGSEKSETSVRESVRKLAKKRAEAIRKKNYPTERKDVGTGLENNILPERYWPRSVRKAAEKVRSSGGEFYVTMGQVHYLNSKGEHKVADGVTVPKTGVVLVRADSNSRLPGQIAGHELLHWDILLDESLRDRLKYQILSSVKGLEIDKLYDFIEGRYSGGGVYGSFEGHFDEYFEEFLCDLNGDVRDRAIITDKSFNTLRSVVLKSVQEWETERNTGDMDSSAQGDTGRPSSSSSNRTRDGPRALEEDGNAAKFTSWNDAFLYLENLPGTNLAFAEPPMLADEMVLGMLDSHGKWSETLGTYTKSDAGLAEFNSDIEDFLADDTISDEELNALFPPTDGDFVDDGYGYNYEDQDADVPGFLSGIYARSQKEASDAVQTNRDGFTKTDTKAFRKWFNDPSGEFTNPDGQPKVFLRGSIYMGATKAHEAGVAKSKGIFFTTDPSVAQEYASGVSSGEDTTLMDEIKGDDNLYLKELPRKYFRGWGPAKDYILRHFQAYGNGLRLVGLDANGNEVSRISDAETFSLQTNAATDEQFRREGWFAEDKWRELASFPKTKQGLEDFNYRLGDIIRENKLGIRGYGKYFLTSDNTLVVDAQGDDYHGIRSGVLPSELRSGDAYVHIDNIAERAFQNGYDAVVVKNVDDAGGAQTQYIVKNSSQVKSVYNRGTWDGSRPDFLFLTENEDHRQKLEDFFKKLEEEYGGGSAEAMFQTFEQLDRARQRAEERAADAEAAQQAAEWATEAAVEAAKMEERERADKKLQKQKDAFQEKARQKAAEARLSKAKAVQSARLAEQMNAGRQWAAKLRRQDERATAKAEAMRKSAEERMNQLRAGHQQELDDARLAERMNAGRKVAQAKRKGLDAVAREKAKREQDHKLASKDAKTAASVLRKYHKADTEKLTNAPVSTLREAYHKPTARDAVKDAADKLRTAHREFYKAFINGTQAVDDFSKYQKVDANTSVLLRTAMASGSTVQSIRQDHLVGKDGSVIDERSLEDVVICWDGSGKHRKYNDDKQRVLQDYMLHRHNIDRMSFREKALNAVESYEQSYPWLTSLEPREFSELVADGNRIAQRYQELIEQFQKAKDKPIFTDSEGKPVTAEFSRNLVSQYEHQYDWVKEKAEGIYDWWDKFMQEWVVGDSLSAEEYATLRETYPAYVPTYRKDKPGLGKGVSSFGGTVTAKKAVRAATGGTSAVANIEDSFNMLMEKNVSSQRTNMVLRSITDTAMLDDAGDFNGFAVFDWNEAPEMLRWGLAAEGFEGALEAGTDQAAAKALSKDDGGVYRVRAWANGERVSAIVDPELYKALDFAFNQKTGWFTKVGQTLTSPMKTFVTGINPAFAVRNTIRDNLTAQMNSISVVNSISGIKFEKYYAKAWQEMVSGSENWQHFAALGGTNAGYYNNEGGTYITNLNRQKMQDLNPINKVGKALGFIGEHTEQVTRFAEYLATIDRLPGGDTYGNRLVGIKNAAEVTVDFSRKGTLGKAFNAWIPYWNPTVQGIDKTVRTFFDQPTVAGKAKVLSRAALTTLPLDVLLFAIYHALDRDDEWEELSDRTKDTYYCIPMKDEHKFLKIPKSRDWGQIIGNPIMRMLQGLDGREDPFDNYFEVSIKPNFLWSNPLDAVLLSTQYDLAKNEDFAGRAIVPSNYQKMAKGDQWNSDTSKYAKVIADIGNMFVEEDVLSPMQIDYVINDYFGDFGSMFQRMFSIGGNDKQASAEEQAKMVAEDLLGNWVADNRYSSATVSDYYDMLDKVSQEVAAERVQNPNGYKDTPMYKLNSAFNAKGSASDQITELNAKVRELPDGPEKDEIKGQIVELAREALQMYDAVMSGDITEPKMEMEYSKYGDKVKNALTDLADYSEDYAFLPSDYKPSSYTDPKNKNKEYVLDDAAKAKYREMYDEEYASVMEEVIKSSKYRSASAEKRAELLEAARDDVAPQVKEEFLKWLAKNYKSTPKKK